jgi:hypothetical protein
MVLAGPPDSIVMPMIWVLATVGLIVLIEHGQAVA